MKEFSTDHYFQIGDTHHNLGKPCQDYALSGWNTTLACAVVSDGCSSGRQTDVGARMQTLATLQAIREEALTDDSPESIIARIHVRRQSILRESQILLGLHSSDMLATNAYACVGKKGAFVHLEGDGIIAVKYNDGRVHMNRYEWRDNTPFYPAYESSDMESFIAIHGGNLDAERVIRTVSVLESNGDLELDVIESKSLRVGLRGFTQMVSEIELSTIECIAVFTDGVTQIDQVNWRDAVHAFLSFKNFGGEFAKRRMIRGIKDMKRNGKGPLDDIAYAVIHLKPMLVSEEVTTDGDTKRES